MVKIREGLLLGMDKPLKLILTLVAQLERT